MDRVKGKVVIVTGGAVGIGRAVCELLAREGARVAVTDVQDEAGRALADEIAAAGGEAAFWHLDVSRENEVRECFAGVVERFGRLDAVVNNAGIGGANKPTHELTEEEWDALFAVNVKGVFFGTKHAIPYLLEAGGGSIVNLSSIYGMVGAPDAPPYHASKGAVTLMSKTDAMLYAGQGIRVNSVHPGFIVTPLVEGAGAGFPGGWEAFKEYLIKLHPIGHLGDPLDVAYGVLYLVSDESKFVTGSQLVIDGGYTAQ